MNLNWSVGTVQSNFSGKPGKEFQIISVKVQEKQNIKGKISMASKNNIDIETRLYFKNHIDIETRLYFKHARIF